VSHGTRTLARVSTPDFADLLEANDRYRAGFALEGFDGVARAGVAMITCMDSRIEPLEMIGLTTGDAKIIRTPGGRVTPDALVGCVLGVHLLGVTRILVVPHTRCAMASGEDVDLLRTHPHVGERATVGGFLYDVDSGALEQLF